LYLRVREGREEEFRSYPEEESSDRKGEVKGDQNDQESCTNNRQGASRLFWLKKPMCHEEKTTVPVPKMESSLKKRLGDRPEPVVLEHLLPGA
jgi:hypothetical protein